MDVRDEGESELLGGEAPLGVDGRECLEEGKNESVAEAREEGATEDDGLADKHLEGSEPDDSELLQGEPVLLELGWAVHVSLARRAAPLGFAVKQDGDAGLGREEVDGLDGQTEE